MMRMKKQLALFSLLCLLLPDRIVTSQEILTLEELRPGMMATAKTIFQGEEIEAFGVEILDILHNFYPKRSVVIVRLHGEKAEFTGPTAGMSGSPVYYEDRLIGALAYAFSPFPKDPIMGVTPISEMLEIFDHEQHREKERAYAGHFDRMQRFLEVATGLAPPDWQAFVPPAPESDRNTGLQRLPLPLYLGGFSNQTFELAHEPLSRWHFVPMRGGSAGSRNEGSELTPGAPVAAVLVSGDFDIAATGTVTYRSGNKILGFGHSFFDNGPIELPMAQAHVLVTLSSSLGSSKLATTGRLVGTLRQDRTTGVMGEIGALPEMTDVEMTYIAESGARSSFRFAVMKEPTLASFAPLLLRLALINGIESARLGTGFNTLQVRGFARIDDGTKILLDNLYPGIQPTAAFSFLNSVLHSTGEIAATLAAVTNNPYKAVQIAEVKVEFTSLPGRKSATLEEVWVDKTIVEPGDTIAVTYSIRPRMGEPQLATQKLVVPGSIKGRTLTVVVGGASALNLYERRYSPGKFDATSYKKLIEILKKNRRNDRLFFQLRLSDQGVTTENEELPGLPPSVYPVLTYRNSQDETRALRDWVVQEIELPQPYMVEGLRAVRLRIQ